MKQPLGESDPLQQLRDIHLPEPVGWWPPAPGWWILAALVIGLLLFLLVQWRKRQQLSKYRREALQILAELQAEHQLQGNNREYLQELLRLLRRVVKTAYPEQHWEALSTNLLLEELNLQIHETLDIDVLLYADRPEQPISASQLDSFVASLRNWILHHRITG